MRWPVFPRDDPRYDPADDHPDPPVGVASVPSGAPVVWQGEREWTPHPRPECVRRVLARRRMQSESAVG